METHCSVAGLVSGERADARAARLRRRARRASTRLDGQLGGAAGAHPAVPGVSAVPAEDVVPAVTRSTTRGAAESFGCAAPSAATRMAALSGGRHRAGARRRWPAHRVVVGGGGPRPAGAIDALATSGRGHSGHCAAAAPQRHIRESRPAASQAGAAAVVMRHDHRATPVSPEAPRHAHGLYWGYRVRLADSLQHALELSGCDVKIGTSDKGHNLFATAHPGLPHAGLCRVPAGGFRHLLLAFGGVHGLEHCRPAGEPVCHLFDAYINVCPQQGSRTIRTEEALLIANINQGRCHPGFFRTLFPRDLTARIARPRHTSVFPIAPTFRLFARSPSPRIWRATPAFGSSLSRLFRAPLPRPSLPPSSPPRQHVRSALHGGEFAEKDPRRHQGPGAGCQFRVQRERRSAAGDGQCARVAGVAAAARRGLRPLPSGQARIAGHQPQLDVEDHALRGQQRLGDDGQGGERGHGALSVRVAQRGPHERVSLETDGYRLGDAGDTRSDVSCGGGAAQCGVAAYRGGSGDHGRLGARLGEQGGRAFHRQGRRGQRQRHLATEHRRGQAGGCYSRVDE
eukprot:ctg_147.g101